MKDIIYSKDEVISKIEQLIIDARLHVVSTINYTLLTTYMEIGKVLVEYYRDDSSVNNKSLTELSKMLTKKLGKCFSRANIWNMINFYKENGIVQTLSERLSWSHYCELLIISDINKRKFMKKNVLMLIRN